MAIPRKPVQVPGKQKSSAHGGRPFSTSVVFSNMTRPARGKGVRPSTSYWRLPRLHCRLMFHTRCPWMPQEWKRTEGGAVPSWQTWGLLNRRKINPHQWCVTSAVLLPRPSVLQNICVRYLSPLNGMFKPKFQLLAATRILESRVPAYGMLEGCLIKDYHSANLDPHLYPSARRFETWIGLV